MILGMFVMVAQSQLKVANLDLTVTNVIISVSVKDAIRKIKFIFINLQDKK
jgi:hypothetical protein